MSTPGRPEHAAPSSALREVLLAAALANHTVARRLGVGPTDLTALDHLLDGPARGTRELADLLGMRPPSASVLVDRLEAADLVRRQAHPADRRRVLVGPTDHGRARTAAVLADLLDDLDGLAADLGPAEQQVVTRYLRAVAQALRRFGQEPDEPGSGGPAGGAGWGRD